MAHRVANLFAITASLDALIRHDQRDSGEVALTWQEAGGPAVSAASPSPGFGSRLILGSVSGNLNGRITHEWPSTGGVVTLHIPSAGQGT